MPPPGIFFPTGADFVRACERGHVITANERLARECRHAVNAFHIDQGDSAWPTPRIASIGASLLRWFQEPAPAPALGHMTAPTTAPKTAKASEQTLLRPLEFQLLARDVIAGESGMTDLDPRFELLPALCEAWDLLVRYAARPLTSAPLAGPVAQLTRTQRSGARWLKRIWSRLEADNAITTAQLPQTLLLDSNRLQRIAAEHPQLLLVGFDTIEPALERLFDALRERGVAITRYTEPAPVRARVQRVELPDESAEMQEIARWTRQILEQEPDANIGIVHPQLQRTREALRRTVANALQPARTSDRCDVLMLAGGSALASEPVWRAARNLLNWGLSPQNADHARSCLQSEFLTQLPTRELPTGLRRTFTLADMSARCFPNDPTLDALARVRESWPVRQTLGAWTASFTQLLRIAGWRADDGSVQFQAYEDLQEVWNELSGATVIMRAERALHTIEQLLSLRTFAPQSPRGQVQILGTLETTALRFTHLWIAGMRDTNWPADHSVNPFVSAELARQLGIPRSSPLQELEFAQQRLQHWQASTNELVYSHARYDLESEYDASPLLRDIPCTDQSSEPDAPATSTAGLPDNAVTAWHDDRGTNPRGRASLWRHASVDQSGTLSHAGLRHSSPRPR